MARARVVLWLGVTATTALALRIWHVWTVSHAPPGLVLMGDPRQYVDWALRITGGDWLGSVVFYQTPLYPYLLALVFSIAGSSIETVRIVQALGGAVATVLVAVAGGRWFGWPAGLAAGGLLAIFPTAIFFDGLLQKSSLDLLLMALLLLSLSGTLDRAGRGWIIAMGLTLGCLLINRETARLFYPLLLVWLLRRTGPVRRAQVSAALLFTACVALPVLPVAVRNYVVGGEWVVSTSQLGSTFYIGNRQGATGLYIPLLPERGSAEFERVDATRLATEAAGRELSAGEVSNYWLERAFADIAADPAAWLAVMARKARLVLSAAEAMDTESQAFHADYSPVLRYLSWFSYGLLLPLAVLGAWLTAAEWRRTWILAGLVALTLASTVLFIVIERYRFPAVPILVLLAGAGIARLGDWRAMSTRSRTGCAVAVATTAIVANLPMQMPADASYANAAAELLRTGRPHEAIALFERAVERSPDDARTRYDLAHAYDEAGRSEDAVRMLRATIDLVPADAESRRVLAVTLSRMGRHDEALRVAEQAVARAPDSTSVLEALGTVRGAAGQPQAAIEAYHRVLALDPEHVTTLNNLANLVAASGDLATAITLYRRAIETEPSYAEARGNLAMVLERAGEPEAAMAEMREAVRVRPDNPQMHAVLGDLLLRQGRLQEAREVFTAGVAVAGADPRADVALRVRLTSLLVSEGRVSEALTVLHEALAIARATSQTSTAAEIEQTIRALRR